jgi:hypothetical protein
MADTTPTKPAAKKTPAKSAKGATTKASGPVKSPARKTGATTRGEDAPPAAAATTTNTAVAKSRFNAALEEAKAGAAALRAEAGTRVGAYGEQAKDKGTDLVAEAKVYGEQALGKAGELAVEGKKTASDAIARWLSRISASFFCSIVRVIMPALLPAAAPRRPQPRR